jgi:predicted DNA-binding transcriptional regulator YafY
LQLIGNTPAPRACFTPSLEACLKQRCLAFNYYSPASDVESTRIVDPYHLDNYMGTWHLIAWCHEREDLRDFVLARMKDTQVLDETFCIPENFDIHKHMQSAFGIFKGKPKDTVTLRFSPWKSCWIKGQVWHKDQKEKLFKDGSLELTFPVSSFNEIMMVILSHGSDVEVIKPKALRTLIKDEAKRIARLY